MMKKTTVLCLVLTLLVTAASLSAAAASDPYFSGSGTEADPYLIQTPKDLATLVYLTTDYGLKDDNENLYYDTSAYTIPSGESWTNNGKAGYYCGRWGNPSPIRYYKMTADLDMSGYDFSKGGIGGGNSNVAFAGHFDGDGHVIRNWKSSGSGTCDNNGIFAQAHFGNVPGQGIYNLGVEGASVTVNGGHCGVLAGWMSSWGSAGTPGIFNCYVKDSETVRAGGSSDGSDANGAMVGYVDMASGETNHVLWISGCYVSNVSLNQSGSAGNTAETSNPGGIVGRYNHRWVASHRLQLKDCYTYSADTAKNLPVVGIVPVNEEGGPGCKNTITFENCYQPETDSTWLKASGLEKSSVPGSSDAHVSGTGNLASPVASDFTAGVYQEDVLLANGGLPVFPREYSYITNTLEAGENGALSVTPVEGEVRQDGNKVYIKQGSGLTVTAEPAEFYRLSSLTYQGQDQIENFVTGTANYPFESLEDGGTWIASFEKVKPSVVVNSTVRTGIYNDAPSAVAYAKFSGLHPSEYGMFLQRASGTGKELQLEAKGNADGQFAIRVFGEGVKTGSFTMQPYFIANEGDDPQRGDKTDSFSLEQ